MNAPDRTAEVITVSNQHPEAFGEPTETNDERRLHLLLTTLIPELNKIDDNKWGALRKDDQGGKIPCDIIVWKDTLEHFDIFTRTGGSWQPRGVVTNVNWHWMEVTSSPPPAASGTVQQVLVELLAVKAELEDSLRRVNSLVTLGQQYLEGR